MRRAGSARLVCVARYAPGFLHRENVDDFIFAKEDPNQSGHPIRITMFKPPKDGEAIIGCEYGGYRAPAGTRERKHGVIKDVTFYKPGDRLPSALWRMPFRSVSIALRWASDGFRVLIRLRRPTTSMRRPFA